MKRTVEAVFILKLLASSYVEAYDTFRSWAKTSSVGPKSITRRQWTQH